MTFIKNPLVLTTFAGLMMAGVATITPTSAAPSQCMSEIKAIDKVVKNRAIDAETLSRISNLRESAIARESKGDQSGCMNDVIDIKALLGL